MPNLIACGEMLIDFVSTVSGVTLVEAPAFEKAAGGAPANVAVGVARLGLPSGFMGKVGDDEFGRFLKGTLEENGVDASRLLMSGEARTGLAFVSLRADGDRDFMFYRNPSADMLLAPGEVDAGYVASARAFHFGSITLGSEPSCTATLRAAQVARDAGLLVSYDPNVRLNLWPSQEAARRGAMLGWSLAQVIKVSEEELHFLTGIKEMERAARRLWHEGLWLLAVTQGPSGCTYFTQESSGYVPGFDVRVVDTTGAGDAFVAGLLYRLVSHRDESMAEEGIKEALRFANAAGALASTRRGAIPSLPTRGEVDALIGEG